jgi:ABC-type sugar transport system substrate-binding protein
MNASRSSRLMLPAALLFSLALGSSLVAPAVAAPADNEIRIGAVLPLTGKE